MWWWYVRDMNMIEFRLEDGGQLPKRGSESAAGFDIQALEDGIVYGASRTLFRTGVFLNRLPPNTYLRIAPRSKLANKFGLDVLAGVVDADYRGEIMVILYNTGIKRYNVEAGDAIAQLIPEQIAPCLAVDVTNEPAFIPTERGESGINSEEQRR